MHGEIPLGSYFPAISEKKAILFFMNYLFFKKKASFNHCGNMEYVCVNLDRVRDFLLQTLSRRRIKELGFYTRCTNRFKHAPFSLRQVTTFIYSLFF